MRLLYAEGTLIDKVNDNLVMKCIDMALVDAPPDSPHISYVSQVVDLNPARTILTSAAGQVEREGLLREDQTLRPLIEDRRPYKTIGDEKVPNDNHKEDDRITEQLSTNVVR